MAVVRVMSFLSLALMLGCAAGVEVPYGEPIDDGDDRYDGPPEVVHRFDGGRFGVRLPSTDAIGEESEIDAGVWLTLEDGGFPFDEWGDASVEPSLATQGAVDGLSPARDLDGGVGVGAGASRFCRAGVYTGAFAGEIQALHGAIRIGITGTLRFTLPSSTDARLTLQRGALDGRDRDGHPVRASIAGTLDCATGHLQGGRLLDGTYTRPDPLAGGRVSTAQFTGVVSGAFGAEPGAARGNWAVDSDRNGRTGSGSWAATLSPSDQ